MNTNKELKWNELKTSYQPSEFSFITTKDVSCSDEMIGQDNAYKTLQIGLKMKSEGYNIYISGEKSSEKEKAIYHTVAKQAQKEKVPYDLVYVYNFNIPEEPLLIKLECGEGINFKEDMEEFSAFILNELPERLKGNEVQKEKKALISELEAEKDKILLNLYEKAQEESMEIKTGPEGISFFHIHSSGEPISKQEYELLSAYEKQSLNQKIDKLYEYAEELIRQAVEAEEKYEMLIQNINIGVVLDEVGALVKYLLEKYKKNKKLQQYIMCISQDIIEHIELLSEVSDKKAVSAALVNLTEESELQKLVKRYQVNLIVNHEAAKGAPFVAGEITKVSDLTGKILLDTSIGAVHSDFSNIRPGLFHQANGGYLLLDAAELLEIPGAWQALKKVLRTKQIKVEGNEEMGIALTSSIKPEAVEADLKVILMGEEKLYSALKTYDADFGKLFKVNVQLEEEIPNTKETVEKLAQRIKSICKKEKLNDVTIDAVLALVDYGKSKVMSVDKLPGNLDDLLDLVREAQMYAKGAINKSCIQKAVAEREKNDLVIAKKIDERMEKSIFLIDTESKKVGQINGLAFYELEHANFGRPVRITATTYRGKKEIVDIEDAARLSGAIHTKGIHIITGFLGNEFAQDMPLSLSANICFEQNYGPIDGDSASSAELYAILSSLAGCPIKQWLAVTGSVNQFGEIQPIGGVNEKIEGFFEVCKRRGLKGREGVIIPKQNTCDLMLKDELIKEVKNGNFHIYAVSTVWEGIELLMDENKNEISKKVKQKLKYFNA